MTPPASHSKPTFTSTTSPLSPWSPPPTAPVYTTDDLALAKYNRLSRLLQWAHILISTLTLAASITITACAGVALHTYFEDKADKGVDWLLPIWPNNIDLRTTRAEIAVGAIIAAFSLTYLVAAFAPLVSRPFINRIFSYKFSTVWRLFLPLRERQIESTPLLILHCQKSKPRLLPLLSLSLTSLSVVLTLFAVIFGAVISKHHSSASSGTLNSWTCKWRPSASSWVLSPPPPGFEKVCDNSSAAYDVVILLFVFEVLGMFASAWSVVVGKRLGKAERGLRMSKVELVEGRV